MVIVHKMPSSNMSLHALTLTSYDRAELKRAFSQQFAQMKLIDAMHAVTARTAQAQLVMASAPDDPSTTHPDSTCCHGFWKQAR